MESEQVTGEIESYQSTPSSTRVEYEGQERWIEQSESTEISDTSDNMHNENTATCQKLKILGATSKFCPVINRQSTIVVEGLVKAEVPPILIVKGLAKPNILRTYFLTANSVKVGLKVWLGSTTENGGKDMQP
ncbi:hypothetical protein PR048_013282 [Dryococelus australis]|uniref:Uncharacterized protein n=1 Tax=Dryococelus australis TaxID=614101 RepID=A0ABQ9HRT2_9NEOP|nr:hypothetical protein PR048_013282 [Dryococelus australis]